MNIETKWLEDFLSLAQSQSFSRSAAERHLTQPAFSRRIQALEAAVGCALVDRRCMPVELTAEGRLFQESASNLLQQLESCIRHMHSLGNGGAQVIDFAVSHALSLSLFPQFLQSVKTELSSLTARQMVANADDCVQALKNGVCEFLLAFEDLSLEEPGFTKLLLQHERLVPVCRADTQGEPLFNLDSNRQQKIPLLGYTGGIYLGRCLQQLLERRPRSIVLETVFESSLADSLKGMALQGLGVAWVPAFSVKEELAQEALVICGSDLWQAPLNICIYRQQRGLSVMAEQFWELMLQRRQTAGMSDA
ncbi:LysR substrate-binding domain-containing protein [Neptuniibacter halophilus]|uniref:LysR substrate-binding domain-containing protein n=1 Tax=Neptuniibacter halophilus TaxID=651666 RepID=UPI0025732B13|nr:LysR substrate-binding domain-containing protein [Neptuniibacter halophilus]